MKSFPELVDEVLDTKNLHQIEGPRGVKNLNTFVGLLGYSDPAGSSGEHGQLIRFLEDNPGAIEALHNWVAGQRTPEWREALAEVLEQYE